MKIKRIILCTVGFMLLLVFLVFNYKAPRMIIEINSGFAKPVKQGTYLLQTKGLPLKVEAFQFISDDHLKLQALLVKTDSLCQKGTVILVHGIRSHKEQYLSMAKRLAERGYNSVLVDLRAHGQSEGKYCTFGNKEKKDISVLVDTLFARKDISKELAIWGQSLGAAVSLQALSIEKRLKVGIIESSYSDYRQIVHDYATAMFGFDAHLLIDYCVWRTEGIGDFRADETVPYKSAEEVTQAVLMVHGDEDDRIKIAYGKMNFEHLASQNKAFLTVKGAKHIDVWKIGGDAYFNKVLTFLKAHLVACR